jgi:hypothetical protein
MPAKRVEPLTPLENPVIWKLTRWARHCVPGLHEVTHRYCPLADEAHGADRRLYAHTFHRGVDEDTICWARAADRLKPNTLEADIAIQDVLDPYHVQLRYRGRNLVQWVDFPRLLRGIEP